MVKWADYGISHVRYDNRKKHIEELKVMKDLGDEFGISETWKRTKVIDYLINGKTFCTVIKGENGWKKGANVIKTRINGKDYIKTQKDSIEADNLGKLPTF